MSDDDIPVDQADESSTSDSAETAADGGAVATEAPQSRFWGVVPSEWELVDGSEVYDVNPSYTPEEEEITYIEMKALDTELPFPKYTTKRKAADYSGKLFREGDTLFARITPCTENGKTAFVDEMETDVGIGSTEYAVLSPDRERIHPLYLYYVAKSHPVRNYAITRMRGSTGRQRVPFDVFRQELDLSLPPLAEQRKITSVLYTVDQLIQKSGEIRQQTQRVRGGVLQDLMQFGINDDNEIRNGSSEFKEVGEQIIPADWEKQNLGNIGEWKSGKTPKRSEESYWNGSIPWITAKDMKTLRIGETEESITDVAVEEGAKVVPSDAVLILVRGMILDHTVPIVRPTRDVSFNQDVKAILPKDGVNSDYLAYWLESNSKEILGLVTAASHGTKRLSTESLGKLSVPLPPSDEQESIVSRIKTFDDKIKAEKQYEDQLKVLKRGLLQDLLTGDTRTDTVDIPVLNEVISYE